MAVVTKGASKAKRWVGRKSLKKDKATAHRRNRRNTKNTIQKEKLAPEEIDVTQDIPELDGWDTN